MQANPMMRTDRRSFLKHAGAITAAGAGMLQPEAALANARHTIDGDGVLVDLTQCVGCRLCEYACRKSNGIDTGPLESYDDASVCNQARRPAPDAFTVVNATSLPATKPI